jgi:hypothetical protein
METPTKIGRRQVIALGGAVALSTVTLPSVFNRTAVAQEATPPASPEASPEASIKQIHVRFTVDASEIVVRIADNPTSRDFLSMLPLILEFEDFANMEKISYLPRELTTEGSAGVTPANGDLIYFVPWGNLGFFYNAELRDQSFDDRVILIGAIETGEEFLDDLENGPVHVEVIA